MKRNAVVIGALLLLFALAWAAVDKLPISETTKASIKRRLIVGFGLAVALAAAVVGMLSAPAWVPWAVAGGSLILTGTYNLTADLLNLPGATPGPGDSPGGSMPDPCIVGPYMAGGRAYVCTR